MQGKWKFLHSGVQSFRVSGLKGLRLWLKDLGAPTSRGGVEK